MSSPLNANATASLLQDQGFTINPVAVNYMGVSQDNDTYVPGTTVTSTCLYDLTRAIHEGYLKIGVSSGEIHPDTYDSLISIGADTIPALGNSKSPTYMVVDPSGMWSGQATTGYAISGNTGQGQDATWIPYDLSNPNSSVTQWGYLRLHALQAWNEFNWNGDNTITTTVTAGNFIKGTLYTILDVGTTDFTLIGASSNTIGVSFIATGVGSGDGTATYINVRYQDFLSSFMSADSFIKATNPTINTFANAPTFLDGVYSNMNDLISSDLTGVSLSTTIFGQDCITLGKVINLTQLQKFGLPSVLLQTIKKYNAITQSLSLALLSTGLSASEIESIAKGSSASALQEQQIYGAFLIIMGQDLVDILIPLNCKTLGLESLADLLDVKKIFPNSYRSLTVPLYNLTPANTNSKTYYLIYDGSNVSSGINTLSVKAQVGTIVAPGIPVINDQTTQNLQDLPTGFGSYLVGILPDDIALAAGAFRYSMLQVKNIQSVDFEKFSQVMFNIETTKDLTLVNGTSVPTDITLVNNGIDLLGLGSGPNNTYTVSDFFGCMSGLPYDWAKLTQLILNTQTPALATIYTDLYNAIVAGDPGLDALVQSYIDAANQEITDIYNTNSQNVQDLNQLYYEFGKQLMREQRARYIALPPVPLTRDTRLNPYPLITTTFASGISQYSTNTLPHMEAQTLEAISDLSTTGGQSIVANMRESRNQSRLLAIGVPLDNEIPDVFANEKELLCNGVVSYEVAGISYVTVPSTLAQTISNIEYAPQSQGSLLMPGSVLPDQNFNPYILPAGDNELINAVPTVQSIQAPVYVTNNGLPLDVGQAAYPSSFAGSTATNLVPVNLNTTYSSGTTLPSAFSISEAINQVIHCNCECWLG